MFRTTRYVKFKLIDISLGILQISPVDCFLWIKLIIMIYYNTRRG
nr:MAG TPA: Non-structural protein 1 virus, RNA-binding domain, RNA.0A [Caudoviricetes sp.]